MRIHLTTAAGMFINNTCPKDLLGEALYTNSLFSYAYRDQKRFWERYYQVLVKYHETNPKNQIVDLRPRILIDSGAFTAYTTGQTVLIEDYFEWSKELESYWKPRVKSLEFFNLDVIGNQQKSDVNLHKLQSNGLNVIPIFTKDADIKYLKYYLENFPYIGLGGLVGSPKIQQQSWLDYCFKHIIDYKNKIGILRKIHLLGVTSKVLLARYPIFSCDSSSWTKSLRFGGGKLIGQNRIPKYSQSKEALQITIAILRAEIRQFQQMQNELTKLWKARGLIWNDE